MASSTKLESILEDAYRQIGAVDADVLYIYSDFRYFGQFTSEYPGRNEFCEAIVAPLLEQNKTILMPSFSYTATGKFDVLNTRTRLGALNKWMLKHPDRKRSEHPLFSYVAIGPAAASLVEGIGKSAFGHDSVHARLRNRKAGCLHIGRPVSEGNTVLHFVEQTCGATYRIHKSFRTEVFKGDDYIGTDYNAFLRRRDVDGEDFEFRFEKAAKRLFESNLVTQVGSDSDLSNVSFYWYDQALDCLLDSFYNDQRLFIDSDFMQY